MEITLLSLAQYESLVKILDEIKSLIANKVVDQSEKIIDSQEFLQLMKISSRTAQAWRDEGIISFSQIGSKIFYRMSDITRLLDRNYKPSFNEHKNKKGGHHL